MGLQPASAFKEPLLCFRTRMTEDDSEIRHSPA